LKELGPKNLNRIVARSSHTKRALKEEDLRWMTARGAQDQRVSRSGRVVYKGSRRNRPVLVRLDGKCITMKEARK
jgi:hypothetical protein